MQSFQLRRFHRTTGVAGLVLLASALWIFWLRWPSFGVDMWNMDEGIYATIGRVILDGGVMYRDGVDNRTPLTHYLSALIYGIVGINNQWGAHAVLAGTIAITGFALFLLARRLHGTAPAGWTAAAFAALSCALLHEYDRYALATEWFVILFTSWSAWWLFHAISRGNPWAAVFAGGGYACAFLSKQPGLLDFGAPLATVFFLGAARELAWQPATRLLFALLLGFLLTLAAVFAYFALNGALEDFILYAWVFNVVYYTTETSTLDRLNAAFALVTGMWAVLPVLLLASAAAALGHLWLLAQRRPTEEERAQRTGAVFVLAWLGCSMAGAAAAGRIYGHYYLQALPAFSLLVGSIGGALTERLRRHQPAWVRGAALVGVLAIAWSVIAVPIQRRWKGDPPRDAGTFPAAFIRENSKSTDRIFVWGFNPDLYLFANRAPATRYVYCGFQTGLVPWTNADPGIDTSYAIVPGTMEVMLAELERERPEFFVDGGLGAGRRFEKYPLQNFPRLAAFVERNYVEVEPARFRPHGFRVLMIKDAARRAPVTFAGQANPGELAAPRVVAPQHVGFHSTEYIVSGKHAGGGLQGLELWVDDAPVDRISFEPMEELHAHFVLRPGMLGFGRHKLSARAFAADGTTRDGEPLVIEVVPPTLPEEQRRPFALPMTVPGSLPDHVAGAFGARASRLDGNLYFEAHAPSVLRYPLEPGGATLRGSFGIDPGAYAPGNRGPTDGAVFVITWVSKANRRTELFRRALNPAAQPHDRGMQSFTCKLPEGDTAGTLELSIDPGPVGNGASDWTYWANLLLER